MQRQSLPAGTDASAVRRAQTRTKEQGLQLTSIQVASAIYTSPVAPKADTRPQLAAGIAVAGAIVFAFIGWMIYLESEKSRSCCGYHWSARSALPAFAPTPAAAMGSGQRSSVSNECACSPRSNCRALCATCSASRGDLSAARQALCRCEWHPRETAGADAGHVRRGMTAVNDGKSAAKASKASKPAAGGVRGWFKRGKAEEVAAGANGADNGNGKLPAHNFDDPKQEVALQPQGASALPPAAPAAGIGRHRIA